MELFTKTRPNKMYSFNTMDGQSYRTFYTPEQIATLYSFMAVDKKNDPIHILSKNVNFQTFTLSKNRKVNRRLANSLQNWFLLS